MKAYQFTLGIIISCLFFSCKKEGVKPSGDTAYLAGKWECAYTFGTAYGSSFFNDSTGAYHKQILEIDNKGRYTTTFIYDGYNNKQTGTIQKIENADSSFIMKDFFPNQKTAQRITFKMDKPKNGTSVFYEPLIVFMANKSTNPETAIKEKDNQLIIAFLGNATTKVYCAYFKK
ncbi:MAG: hypothetical protein IT239_04605 [Bacteroidia bacterium]|nr:hypothetical protein [Bacteroidia bacterium]